MIMNMKKMKNEFKSINRISKNHRISVDIDVDNQFDLMKKYFNMKWIVGNVISYKTGGGYHLLSEKRDRTLKQNIDVRRTLGDCKGRLNLDEDRLNAGLGEYYTEILFYEKMHFGEITEEYIFNILSMPFWGNGTQWCRRNHQ